jgi:hypothetical protein
MPRANLSLWTSSFSERHACTFTISCQVSTSMGSLLPSLATLELHEISTPATCVFVFDTSSHFADTVKRKAKRKLAGGGITPSCVDWPGAHITMNDVRSVICICTRLERLLRIRMGKPRNTARGAGQGRQKRGTCGV